MSCCSHCVDAEGLFSERIAKRELRHYRKKGPRLTTRLLLRAIGRPRDRAMTLLDIGGGVGAIPHELLAAGLARAVLVDASAAYLEIAGKEAIRRGHGERFRHYHGDFVDLAGALEPADIVTLDRVLCCYPDMERLVEASAAKARHIYGLVYPRDRWITRIGMALVNLLLRLRGGAFRTYVHSTVAVEAAVQRCGLERRFHGHTFLWQIVIYARNEPA
jgi:magnesium-protoporphyrin O-methyltransferase